MVKLAFLTMCFEFINKLLNKFGLKRYIFCNSITKMATGIL